MQKCPNCGRPTSRTQDWACQWCGYPLLSGNYPRIPKTYKRLQEERRLQADESVLEAEMLAEAIPESRLKRPPKPELITEKRVKPVTEPETVETEPPVANEVADVSEVTSRVVAKPELMPEAKIIPEAEPRTAAKPELMPEANLVPEVGQEEAVSEFESPPEPAVKVDVSAILEKTSLTAEELDLVYQMDKAAAEAKFAGKTLTVSGAVDRVFANDSLGIYYVLLTGARKNGVWNVRCTFQQDYIPKLKKLSPGQALTVQGKYGGHGKNIILKDCILQS